MEPSEKSLRNLLDRSLHRLEGADAEGNLRRPPSLWPGLWPQVALSTPQAILPSFPAGRWKGPSAQ